MAGTYLTQELRTSAYAPMVFESLATTKKLVTTEFSDAERVIDTPGECNRSIADYCDVNAIPYMMLSRFPGQLPRIEGYNWQPTSPGKHPRELTSRNIWAASYTLKPEWDYKIWIGDWTMPSGSWTPKTWVRVRDMMKFPRNFLRKIQVPITENMIMALGGDIYRATRYNDEGDVIRRERVTSLSGLQIVNLFAPHLSFLMPVAGWPLEYVPMKYLVWLYTDGTATFESVNARREFHNGVRWWDPGVYPIPVVQQIEMKLYGDFRTALGNYLKRMHPEEIAKTALSMDRLFASRSNWANVTACDDDREIVYKDFSVVGHWKKDSFIETGTSLWGPWSWQGRSPLGRSKPVGEDEDPAPEWQMTNSFSRFGIFQQHSTSPILGDLGLREWVPPNPPSNVEAAWTRALQIIDEKEKLWAKLSDLTAPMVRPERDREIMNSTIMEINDRLLFLEHEVEYQLASMLEGTTIWEVLTRTEQPLPNENMDDLNFLMELIAPHMNTEIEYVDRARNNARQAIEKSQSSIRARVLWLKEFAKPPATLNHMEDWLAFLGKDAIEYGIFVRWDYVANNKTLAVASFGDDCHTEAVYQDIYARRRRTSVEVLA